MNIVKKIDLKQLIEDNVSDEDIWEFYLGHNKTGQVFCSVLREDRHPSCSLYYSKSGQLRYKDHATGDNFTAMSYVQALFNISYSEALQKIASDFSLNNYKIEVNPIIKTSKKIDIPEKKPKEIKITAKKFTERDLQYWNSFGINYDTLKLFSVYSVGSLWINKQRIGIKKDELCFAYYFKNSNHLKIYFPEREKGKKWYSNTDNLQDIQGYYVINIKETKPDILVLTSSLKEVMLLWEFGVKALAIHGENSNYHSDFIRHLRKYCKNIVSLYDFDSAGYKAGEKLFKEYNIPALEKPENLNCKDISDCVKEGQIEEVEQFIETIKRL